MKRINTEHGMVYDVSPLREKPLRKGNIVFLMSIIVNVLIPKAGIKLNGIPITLGSLLLFIVIVKFLLSVWSFNVNDRDILALLSFMQIYISSRILLFFLYGTLSLSLTLSYITSICVYPMIFHVIIHCVKTEQQLNTIIKVVLFCFFLTMLYFLLQCIFGIQAVQIPGVTVNYNDYIEAPNAWWLKKMNGYSGGSSKIFSTYQNGNLYGMLILMCYPLFSLYFHKGKNTLVSLLIVILYAICAFLSGSRTVWIGVGIYNLINFSFVISRRKMKLKSIIIFVLFMGVFYILFLRISAFLSPLIGNRLTASLNMEAFLSGAGRTERAIRSFTWLFENGNIIDFMLGSLGTSNPVSDYEMTYFAIFLFYGLFGLILFLLPIYVCMYRMLRFANRDSVIRAIFTGLLTYFICAFIEGAYFLPPTAINLWMFLAIGHKRIHFLS